MSTKFLTYDTLKMLNDSAIRNGLNRSLVFEKLPIAKADVYPVVMAFMHNDIEMRCELILNRHGDSAWLDMPIKAFNELPEDDSESDQVEFTDNIELESYRHLLDADKLKAILDNAEGE